MAELLNFAFNLYIIIVIVRVIFSWVNPDPNNQVVQFVEKATEPVLSKIRQVVPPISGLDLSPMILIFALYILRGLLW